MAEGNMLILDAGTSRVKAGLVAPDGKMLHYASKSLTPKSTQPGEAVTDPADVWDTIRVLTKQLMKGIEAKSVDVVSFTGNRISVSLTDRNGTVLHPFVTWLDSRSATEFDKRIEEVDKRVILQKILWFKESRPDLYAKAASILNLDSYLNTKLVGKPVMWVHSAVYALYDPAKKEWPDKLNEFG
ncbi:MAG TPA: FGGY family carbohydrate kinase, partial [Thermoproteota archaeon]|nr:FGGY family carbohydrate kinase [Thermoproteota archaeon]